ncbi:hypothetical protein TNIN_300671 [Trichonephila inaurata madagascariensis]|uniref:Uncharacterized protein n=1 Tax=Trichonephila inaurata madagascariensis TaxID=2747483 RepID=A0A8X6WSR8_9ARAC|nr:hypothetical protein TNIN_300671 [Trichonephila inaurata madagascariensis]
MQVDSIFFQHQNQSHGGQSYLLLKCSYSNEENLELQQNRDQKDSVNISDFEKCIRTACDVLHGMDYKNDDILSETIFSHDKETFASEFNLSHSKEETSNS